MLRKNILDQIELLKKKVIVILTWHMFLKKKKRVLRDKQRKIRSSSYRLGCVLPENLDKLKSLELFKLSLFEQVCQYCDAIFFIEEKTLVIDL